MSPDPDATYFIDGEVLAKIKIIADRLCGGSDKERDAGNAIVCLVSQAIKIESD